MTKYSRQNPSPSYKRYVQLYIKMHSEGCPEFKDEPIYRGFALSKHLNKIFTLAQKTKSHTLLDYGSGKGELYQPEYGVEKKLGFDKATCYDPGVKKFETLPKGKYDAVICIDVMEHIPEEDIDWIIDEIFSFAKKFVFFNICCFQAEKTLSDGSNAHCTLRSPKWWQEKMRKHAANYPSIIWHMCCSVEHQTEKGIIKGYRHSNNLKYFP